MELGLKNVIIFGFVSLVVRLTIDVKHLFEKIKIKKNNNSNNAVSRWPKFIKDSRPHPVIIS